MSQIDIENNKTKLFQFSRFLCNFVKVSTDFVDWNVFKSQQGNVGCPVVFHEEIIAML